MGERYVVTGDRIPPEVLSAAHENRRRALLAELRFLLAPLLDDPLELAYEDRERNEVALDCRFCGASTGNIRPFVHARVVIHAAGCPVLRRDELLGRA